MKHGRAAGGLLVVLVGQQVAVKMLDTCLAPPGPDGKGTLCALAVMPGG